MSDFSRKYLDVVSDVCASLNHSELDALAEYLARVRDNNGRLFILGVGGSAGNAGHAVNDFRKLCNVEAYAPTDNVSELTARANDEGWDTIFSGWLVNSRLSSRDALLIFSVGGGSIEHQVSINLIEAMKLAKDRDTKIFGIIGPNGGATADLATLAIKIPVQDEELITPISEAYQAIIWHCLVSHPTLKKNPTKW